MQGEHALFTWYGNRLGKRVEARMRDVHEHLKRNGSDEPAPRLQSELEVSSPRKRDFLSETPVGLTVNRRALQVLREREPFQVDSRSVDLELSLPDSPREWLLQFDSENQVELVRDAREGSLLVAVRVPSAPALIRALQTLLIARGRPDRIICCTKEASVVRRWAKIYGVDVVAQLGQRHPRIEAVERVKNPKRKPPASAFVLKDPLNGIRERNLA